jgi:hypothetical protein
VITKEALRRRLIVAKHPRRRDADPGKAPDHNPLVLEDCPACGGSGTRCEMTAHESTLTQCPACAGEGTTYAVVPMFANDAEPMNVRAEADGWMTCPCCGWRFSPADRRTWTGFRHVRCGQRLRLEER